MVFRANTALLKNILSGTLYVVSFGLFADSGRKLWQDRRQFLAEQQEFDRAQGSTEQYAAGGDGMKSECPHCGRNLGGKDGIRMEEIDR